MSQPKNQQREGAKKGEDTRRKQLARRLYTSLRSAHDWGRRFEPEPSEAVLEQMAAMAPREMRRAWMTAFGNARLAGREVLEVSDLPDGAPRRAPIGFMQ